MDKYTADQIEISSILNSVVYLDVKLPTNMTLGKFVDYIENTKPTNEFGKSIADMPEFKHIKAAVENSQWSSQLESMELVHNSCDGTKVTNDPIQACTFRDADGNYYVAYRGTGEGRWVDNGEGMTEPSTAMQEAAADYFDEVAEKYMLDAHANGGKIIVTGHSKGGNEAQYVYMNSEYEHLIDNCYSIDGQGFSKKAIKGFKEKFGEELYNDKVQDMYSINGENDYVHDLGIPIIPEENTYYVETTGNGFADFHHISSMIGEGDTYTGIQWTMEDGKIVNGERGVLGNLSHTLFGNMLELDEDDLRGASLCTMYILEWCMNEENEDGEKYSYNLSDADVTWRDWVDFVAHGVPTVFKTLFLEEEGRAFLYEVIENGSKKFYEKYGTAGVIGVCVVTTLLAPVIVLVLAGVTVLATAIVVVAKIIDFVLDLAAKFEEFKQDIKEFITNVKEAFNNAMNAIASWFRQQTAGYEYATEHPQITIDTYKLTTYADRITAVNSRVTSLESRLDSLYWKVGLLGLWDLMQADFLTSYSIRLRGCANYLNETAEEFENVENDLISKLE